MFEVLRNNTRPNLFLTLRSQIFHLPPYSPLHNYFQRCQKSVEVNEEETGTEPCLLTKYQNKHV